MRLHHAPCIASALFLALFVHKAGAQNNCRDLEEGADCEIGNSGKICTCEIEGGSTNNVCNQANCGCQSDDECEPGSFCDMNPGPNTMKRLCKKNCDDETNVCDDPHMQGLSGQTFDWSGVDGGWYCLVKDDAAGLHVNLRVTAPLPKEFPDRQLITGISVLSAEHSLVIEVQNPYTVDTAGCPDGVSPCLANGGLRAVVDGEEAHGLLGPTTQETVADGIVVSASNLPVECRHFGGGKVWARMYEEMLQGKRELATGNTSERQRAIRDSFEAWILRSESVAAPEWCAEYIHQHDLSEVQSIHSVFKIMTASSTVRLLVGTNYQGNGELDWDGRVLPDMDFWQMNVGVDGLSLESDSLSGLLGETARPVLDMNGRAVMHGYEAFRGTVEDYRVDGPLGTDFALLSK